jgi:hypothetical protein
MLGNPKLIRILILVFSFSSTSFLGHAQDTMWKSLQKHPFPQSIIKSLTNRYAAVKKIDDLTLSCSNSTNFKAYNNHNRYYIVNSSVENVWHNYINTNLKAAWSGKRTNYGFAYNRESQELLMSDHDSAIKPQMGLGFFIELKISKVLRVLVALEVSHVDPKSKIIQFTYLKRNKSKGRQTIVFKKFGINQTIILHQTYYKSDSKFRDKYFYSHYHTNFIDQFHDIILKNVASFKTISLSKMKMKYSDHSKELVNKVKMLETR